MRVDVSKIDPVRFSVEHRQLPKIGQIVLITPLKAMFDWHPDDLHLRSLVVRESDGEVISAGFPKFFNHLEDKASDAIVLAGLSEKRVIWKKKMDGTLIIRSVVGGTPGTPYGHRGHVYLRTRGSHELGSFEEPVMRLVTEKHPELLDPGYLPEGSHLFEYCAPDNQIVLHYAEAKLWALACVLYDGNELKVYDPYLCLSVDSAPHWLFDWEPKSILDELKDLTKEEGYVAWTRLDDGSYHLSKWKTEWYKRMHSLRSQASPRFIKEYCVQHKLYTLSAFQAQLAKDGFDWEFASYLAPSFDEFMCRWQYVQMQVVCFRVHCTAARCDKFNVAEERKELVRLLKEATIQAGQPWLFHYGISLYTGKEENAEDLMLAQVLECGAQEVRNLKKSWVSPTSAQLA